MKADAETEAAVVAVLNEFADAYAQRDLDGVLGLFAPDPEMVFIGTGADEKRIGLAGVRAQAERDRSQSDAAVVKFGSTSVSATGPVAWVAADMSVHANVGGHEVSVPGRLTAVLQRRGDQWLLVQWHFSLPTSEQAEGESWPTSIDAVTSAVHSERPDLSHHAAPDGTVTILFSDIEGSTAITERLGDLRWLELLRTHNAIVREQLGAHDGFEVKEVGDGFMLAFQSARRALQFAVDTQRAFAKQNQSADEPLHVRMGLHTGEVIKEAEDFYGRHVILASRIANEAHGGQILVSSLLKELTESAGDIAFSEGREVGLKGLSGRHHVHKVRWQDED